MQPRSHPRGTLRPWRAVLPAVATLLMASCAEQGATLPEDRARPDVAAAPFTGEVIVNDEEWRGPGEDGETAEIAGAGADAADAGALSFSAAALAPEPRIRVGILYAELTPTVTGFRMSGRDAADPYELRSGSAAGPVLASGLAGDVVVGIAGSGSTAQLRLTLPGGATLLHTGPVVLVSQSGSIRMARSTLTASTVYRGTAEARVHSSGARLIGINELPIEQYLYGVVPRELGPIAFPEVEALKTQAVAARTYARRRLQFCPVARCSNGYHIIPTTGDQVYGSSSGEHPLSTAAVDGTRGVVATYNGGLIDALYSSTTGGWTANSEDVYANPFAYLRGVPDHERGKALDHVPTLDVFRNHGNPTNLRNHANGDFEADWSAYHRWYVDWTAEEMRQVAGRVGSATFIDPGKVYSVEVVSRSSSGRVFELRIVTEKRGTLVARKDAVRSALRYVTYNASGAMVLNSLRSILVYVEPVVDPKTKEVVGWEAWGGGWGHGVGMSQTGAVGMAEKGHTFEQIVRHYYQGVVLEKRWE
ncbi:MAG: SpoIID/LytB domain-containing protein [Gemmatimonadota bacterium]